MSAEGGRSNPASRHCCIETVGQKSKLVREQTLSGLLSIHPERSYPHHLTAPSWASAPASSAPTLQQFLPLKSRCLTVARRPPQRSLQPLPFHTLSCLPGLLAFPGTG